MAPSEPPSRFPPPTDPASEQVLCVEDEPASRTLLAHLLGRRFRTVLSAGDGAEGLEHFRRHHPGLVITDIHMPAMDGIQLARAIREESPFTPVIITTAHGESGMLLAAIEAGVTDFVIKPLIQARLDEAIDKCLRISALEFALRDSKARMESILDSIGDAFFALDAEWRITYINDRGKAHLGLGGSGLLGLDFRTLFPEETPARQAYGEAMCAQQSRVFEAFSPGPELWHEVRVFPMAGGISVYLRDITLEKAAKEEIRVLAFYDKLTGLPNRTLLQERLGSAVLRSRRSGKRGAVIFLDLDRFKKINDSLGHEAGDLVLQEVAKRLTRCIRVTDTAARLGGDEFIIMLEGFEHPDNIHSICHRILFALAEEIPFRGFELRTTGSLGICFFPDDGECVEDLLKAADTAMYHGKSLGRNTYQFFHPEMNAQARQYLILEQALYKAIQNRDFLLRFQPQYDLASKTLVGFEALVRWQHPELGVVLPNDFIPLAEETGLILLLGDWVLENACRQARSWIDRYGLSFRMAVNLSGRQFWHGDLVDAVERALSNTGLPPENLELELTESMVMGDVDKAIEKMRHLSAMGIRLSIDDFGTGYSSLATLKRFPIGTLKIDKSFVKEVTTNPHDAAIATSILALATTMNLSVVAEGIETPDQFTFLRDKGCTTGQGYYFSAPLSAEEVELRGLLEPSLPRSKG